METNAVIIIWKGKAIPDHLVENIGNAMISSGICIPEMLTIKVKDEESISQALLKSSMENIQVEEKPQVDEEALKNAIIYIGEKFKHLLGKDLGMFAIELQNEVQMHKRTISFVGVGSNDELLTAVEIIATTNALISNNFLRKYHFTQTVFDIIKKIYHINN
jgi:hypothetical protein